MTGGRCGRAGDAARAGRCGCPRRTGTPAARSRAAVAWSTADGSPASTATGLAVPAAAVSTASGYDSSPSNSGTRSTASATAATAGSSASADRHSANSGSVSRPVPHTSSGLAGSSPGSRTAASRVCVAGARAANGTREFGRQVGGVRAFQAGVVHGGDAGAGGGAPARGEELHGVGQFGQVADAVQAVRAGQRLPRPVGRGQRAGVSRDQRLAGLRRAHAEQHDRHVRGQRVGQHRAQPGRVPDRLQDQGEHLRLGEPQRVPGVVRGGSDELLAGRDGQAKAETAAGSQQRGEHRTRVGDQPDRPGRQRVRLDVADGPQAAGHVHEPHAARAAQRQAGLPRDRGQPGP